MSGDNIIIDIVVIRKTAMERNPNGLRTFETASNEVLGKRSGNGYGSSKGRTTRTNDVLN